MRFTHLPKNGLMSLCHISNQNKFLLVPRSDKGRKYGYAINWKLSRAEMGNIEDPANMAAFYESTQLKRNHSGDGKDMAYRHLNGTNMAFADGHAKWFAKNDTGKWPNVHFTFKP